MNFGGNLNSRSTVRLYASCVIGTLVFMLCSVSYALAESDHEMLNVASQKILSRMPETWKLTETRNDVLPYGHYDGLKYNGPKGLMLVLVGDRDVTFDWKDKSGIWHREPINKEALELWIMPAKYHLSWKRFFVMKSPEAADCIYEGEDFKVYASVSSRRSADAPQERLEEVLPDASAIGRAPDTPEKLDLTWISWQGDIRDALSE